VINVIDTLAAEQGLNVGQVSLPVAIDRYGCGC
jgi:hypothetical protein